MKIQQAAGKWYDKNMHTEAEYTYIDLEHAFVAGAEWMQEKLAKAIEQIIKNETGDVGMAKQYSKQIREVK